MWPGVWLVAYGVSTPTSTVPPLDLAAEHRQLREAFDSAYLRVRDSGQFVGGEEVAAFEREIAEALGVRHAVGLSSGTDALLLALRIAEVGPGDEVITTPLSFFATSETVLLLGATPVFVDCAPGSFLIDPERVAEAITPRTKAILPVHLYGEVAAMEPLMQLASEHRLTVIEDAAQAIGARGAAGGRMAGGLGHLAAFSFYPTKNIGALGDAGMLTSDDPEMAARARRLRNHGGEQRYQHLEVGYNARLDALQAAFLRAKVPFLGEWTERRRERAQRYDRRLAELPAVTRPTITPGHALHQYTIRVPDSRDQIISALSARGIGAMLYYPHTLERYGGRVHGSLAHAQRACAEVISLPLYPTLSDAAQDRVVEALGEALLEVRGSIL